MRISRNTIAALITVLLISLAVVYSTNATSAGTASTISVTAQRRPGPISGASAYYTLRADNRRCARPFCGGYWVKRVNVLRTRCVDGRLSPECYVSEIDWNLQAAVDPIGRAVLRGQIMPRSQGGNRRRELGVFRVDESWQAATGRRPGDAFYRATDRNVRCITHPCLTHLVARLNAAFTRNIAGVDFTGTGAPESLISEAATRMTSPDGILVTGGFRTVRGPAGREAAFRATQFYLREDSASPSPGTKRKDCMKTGCSNHVCSDENVMTTCEWRPEYACYQKARCERQPNGQCGFTPTPELTACLRRN